MQNRISNVITLPFMPAIIHCFGERDIIVKFSLRFGEFRACDVYYRYTLCYSRNLYINNILQKYFFLRI